MGKLDPYNLQMQITSMFEQGQSFFATTKVQDWLKEHNQNPADYDILFHKIYPKKPVAAGSEEEMLIEIELRRKDGQLVDSWLQEQINLQR
ncbi:hypothetical protein [Calothrix sp. CCY 0018]|uniref:hypothetical protein n=1 Tax=Calothrix sp. CCY 0018 TaxID=3103864 RepID=UPI0039C71559